MMLRELDEKIKYTVAPTTYNPLLAKIKVDPHVKNQGQRLNSSSRRPWTSRQTDRQMLPNALSPFYAVDNTV